MKVFVATKQTQGTRKNDYSHTTDGELVYVSGNECDGESVDGHCGCRRGFSGMTSLRATTTAIVEERECDVPSLARGLRETLKGWERSEDSPHGFDEEYMEAWALEIAEDIKRVAGHFQVGDVVEKRGNIIQSRAVVLSRR